MRLWLALEDWNGFSSEVIHARETGPGLVELDNCPTFVGLGLGDELAYALVEDVDDWDGNLAAYGSGAGIAPGDVDGSASHDGPGSQASDDDDDDDDEYDEDDEDGLPTAVGVKRRSPRRTLTFAVHLASSPDGDATMGASDAVEHASPDADEDDEDDALREYLAEEFGQQCLESGADGCGLLPGSGTVCVPEQASGSDAQAWSWMASQLELTRARLSGMARAALDSGQAQILWQFVSVPEMGLGPVPGLRLPGQSPDGMSDATQRAVVLMEQGATGEALDLLEAAAVHGDPSALAILMLECATAGQWGRAVANSYWAQARDLWEECPEHLPQDQWEEAVEIAEQMVQWFDAAAFLRLDCPDLEAEALMLAGAFASQVPCVEPARLRAMLRAGALGSVNALSVCLWEGVMSGDPGQALTAFEACGVPAVTLEEKLAEVPAALARLHPDLLPALEDMVAASREPGADEWANAQANAGLAYAMQGDEVRALELWAEAAPGSFEARLWPAVLEVFNGSPVNAKSRDEAAIPEVSLASLLEGMEGDCGPWFARWRQAAYAVSGSAA